GIGPWAKVVTLARSQPPRGGHRSRPSATLDAVPVPARRFSLVLAAAIVALVASPSPASADRLAVEERDGESGYTAVDELSYEAIIEPSDGYTATLRLRLALHNNARTARDAVVSLAMPRGSQLQSMQIAKNG